MSNKVNFHRREKEPAEKKKIGVCDVLLSLIWKFLFGMWNSKFQIVWNSKIQFPPNSYLELREKRMLISTPGCEDEHNCIHNVCNKNRYNNKSGVLTTKNWRHIRVFFVRNLEFFVVGNTCCCSFFFCTDADFFFL